MLTINPAKRITADQALKHPWVCVSVFLYYRLICGLLWTDMSRRLSCRGAQNILNLPDCDFQRLTFSKPTLSCCGAFIATVGRQNAVSFEKFGEYLQFLLFSTSSVPIRIILKHQMEFRIRQKILGIFSSSLLQLIALHLCGVGTFPPWCSLTGCKPDSSKTSFAVLPI